MNGACAHHRRLQNYAPTPLKRTGANDSPTSTGYSRAQVHRIAKDHHKPGSGTADDILDPALTTQELVNAVGWLADNFKGDWGFSVINTGHHYDPRAHSGGFSIDIFANNPSGADDAAFMAVVNKDPYFVEIGVSGDYAGLQGAITDSKKCSFIENAPTHVHASVKRAFCG